MLERLKTWFRNLRAAQQNARLAEDLGTQVHRLEDHIQIVRFDYDAIISKLRAEHVEAIAELQSNQSQELMLFGSCQGGEKDHLKCLRPVRYKVVNNQGMTAVLCGFCFLSLQQQGQIKTSEDLEPLKVPSYRRNPYKNESDRFRQ